MNKMINHLFSDDYTINHHKDNEISDLVKDIKLFFDDYEVKTIEELKLYILLFLQENQLQDDIHYHLSIDNILKDKI